MVTDAEPFRLCIDPVMQAAALVDQDLPGRAEAAAMARRVIGEALTSWGFPKPITSDAQLIVTELVTNAVQHTGSPRLRLLSWRGTNIARIGVHDFSREVPVRFHTGSKSLEDEHGRGLRLIGVLSTRWGVDAAIAGKLVWAEIRKPRQAPADAEASPSATGCER